jgi:hypothetical protein
MGLNHHLRVLADSAAALPYWGDETTHRGFLLQLGRSVGGTHFIAIDADEMVVIGDCQAHDYLELRNAMLQMQGGDLFVMKVLRAIVQPVSHA